MVSRLTDAECLSIVQASIDPARLLAGPDGHEGSAPDCLLVEVERIVREREAKARAEAWDHGYRSGLGDYGKNDDETVAMNPYRADREATR